jgi:hypothetical protein
MDLGFRVKGLGFRVGFSGGECGWWVGYTFDVGIHCLLPLLGYSGLQGFLHGW